MPNWCSNNVKIEADEQTRADILDFIKSDETNELIDFDKIITMPKTLHNVRFGGWYDWCTEHWGTKWNARHSQMIGDVLYFRTPWAPPVPVLMKISQMYPDAKLIVGYNIELIANGLMEFKNGEVLKHEEEEFSMDIEEPEEETVNA